MEISRMVLATVMMEDSPVMSKISRTVGGRLRTTSRPPAVIMRRLATRIARMPQLETNGQSVKSSTSSRTPSVGSFASSVGPEAASRRPFNAMTMRSPWVSMVIFMGYSGMIRGRFMAGSWLIRG